MDENDICRLREAAGALEAEAPGRLAADFFLCGRLDGSRKLLDACLEAVGKADGVFLHIHGGSAYFHEFPAVRTALKGKPYFYWSGLEDENQELERGSAFLAEEYRTIRRYFEAGGKENEKNMLKYLAARLKGCPEDYAPVVLEPKEGVLELCREETSGMREEMPVVGILVHYADVKAGNLRHIRALAGAVRSYGAMPLAVYSNMIEDTECASKNLHSVLEQYFQKNGRTCIDALIVTCGFSLSILSAPGDGSRRVEESVFEFLDVPVLQAMTTYYTREQWEESWQGIDSSVLNSNVYQAEYDGQLIGVPIASTERVSGEFGDVLVSVPIPDRVEKLACLAVNWARLHRLPAEQIKVALILHNMPPGNDRIGCVYGLDAPASLQRMLAAMKQEGIQTDLDVSDGEEIIQAIRRGLTNDNRFLSEKEMLRRSADTLDEESYMRMFGSFPVKNQRELERDWGKAPGTFFTAEQEGKRRILIPGLLNGNLFIGLQPPRAREEQAEKTYHSTELVCPHQYLAFYRWVEEVFGANVLVHLGTHGTLEWLPGKGVGLSEECYPDLAAGTLPHLYPYIINVPGEGMQAKRRSCAAVIDHMIPSMKESGLYQELESLEERLEARRRARLADPGKMPDMERDIWKLARSLHLDELLNISGEAYRQDPQKAAESFHEWLESVRHTQIKDGLHIFGQVPEGERFRNLVRLLVRIPNGEIPSLAEGIESWRSAEDVGREGTESWRGAEDAGREGAESWRGAEDAEREAIADGPGPEGATEELEERLLAAMEAAGWQREACGEAAREILGEPAASLEGAAALLSCISFICGEIVPSLRETTDEMKNFLHGLRGGFVPPGPSGSPSRGRAGILPTGRNFYSLDPDSLPGHGAWQTGRRLAEQLLERYREEKQELPESVAIVVYAGDTMKTEGDDLAEILWLYGVRPVWLGNTERVIGLEIIPAEELGRPRIDVTLRISGLFRDTFPNLIERIEDAVNLVAALDEPENVNFVKKHVQEDLRRLEQEGMGREEALEQASARIFGCPPGDYGAGVDTCVASRKWDSGEDLGRAYINWSCHVYGRKRHGERWQAAFERRLASCQVTVKNISSVESDMLDDDDYYIYHGGLVRAVKNASGYFPDSYSADAADPRSPRTRTLAEDIGRIMQARILNPAWIGGLKEHGYRGAAEISQMTDIVFGWDATGEIVKDWMYEGITELYVKNPENRRWMEEVNPWALHSIAGRLLEAGKRGMWKAGAESLEYLQQIYREMEGIAEDEADSFGV